MYLRQLVGLKSSGSFWYAETAKFPSFPMWFCGASLVALVVKNPPANTGDDSEQSRSWIIDTPGIKGFGLLDVEKEEISHYFRDIFRVSRDCRYSNCLHTGEPGCAVYQAVANGEIALSRYESYLSILDDTQESKYR